MPKHTYHNPGQEGRGYIPTRTKTETGSPSSEGLDRDDTRTLGNPPPTPQTATTKGEIKAETRTNTHTPQSAPRNGEEKAKTQTSARTTTTQIREGQKTASLKAKHERHTTVGNPVSIARTLGQPVPCR